jgi:hypothetical protein
MLPTIHSHGLQEHGLGSQSDLVIEEDDITQEEEVITKVARIIEDIENGVVEPTLATFGAEDVIDEIFVYQDDDWSDSSSEGTVDGE